MERDGYNLLTFSQKDLTQWGCEHVWQADDDDMSMLPDAVTAVYNTRGWQCVNTFLDDDGVVFKRMAPALSARGSGAARRRRKFNWTQEMHAWLHKCTERLTYKSIPFFSLTEEAESKWGYEAPEQEHLENKIKSRDNAAKEGRVVKWVNDCLSEAESFGTT